MGDPAFQRDLLCYDMMRKAGIRAPRVAHARIYLNDQYWGVYAIVEQIDKTFLLNNFTSGQGDLFKNMGNSELEWLGNSASSYNQIFELKTNETEDNWVDFIEFVDILNNSSNANFETEIEKVFNVDYYLRVLAIDIMTNNWDSYIEHGRNYYIYHEPKSDLFYWIPWDYNLAMGGDLGLDGDPQPIGDPTCDFDLSFGYTQTNTTVVFTPVSDSTLQNVSWTFGDGSTSVEEMPTHEFADPISYEVCIKAGVMISGSICEQEVCRNINLAFNPANCESITSGECPYLPSDPIFQQVIAEDDFCCSSGWDNLCQSRYDNIANGISGGGGTPGTQFELLPTNSQKGLIKRIMQVEKYRDRYLDYACEILENNFTFERLEPIIDFQGDKIRTDVHSDPFYIFTDNYFDYDVGNGSFSSNGASIPPLKTFIQSRIEKLTEELGTDLNYDWPNLTATLDFQAVTINELMAASDSSGTITDPSGAVEDWIELHNNTTDVISLDGYYLTDDPLDLRKWPFPAGTTISAEGYLIVWADHNLSEEGLHANFALSKTGEDVLLVHSDGTVLDQVTFGEQEANLPIARIPNGIGAFVQQTHTFNANNEWSTSTTDQELSSFQLYPNPSQGTINLVAGSDWEAGESQILIRNMLGQLTNHVIWSNNSQKSLEINLGHLDTGIYLVEVRNADRSHVEKLILR